MSYDNMLIIQKCVHNFKNGVKPIDVNSCYCTLISLFYIFVVNIDKKGKINISKARSAKYTEI